MHFLLQTLWEAVRPSLWSPKKCISECIIAFVNNYSSHTDTRLHERIGIINCTCVIYLKRSLLSLAAVPSDIKQDVKPIFLLGSNEILIHKHRLPGVLCDVAAAVYQYKKQGGRLRCAGLSEASEAFTLYNAGRTAWNLLAAARWIYLNTHLSS